MINLIQLNKSPYYINELKDIGRQGGEIYNVKYKNISKVQLIK